MKVNYNFQGGETKKKAPGYCVFLKVAHNENAATIWEEI